MDQREAKCWSKKKPENAENTETITVVVDINENEVNDINLDGDDHADEEDI